VTISENGAISQGGKRLGAIGMFLIPPEANLKRYDNSAVIPDKPAKAVEDVTTNSVRQGYVEGSNVNPILEMTRLIEVSRAFDQAATAIDDSDNLSQEAIRTLSPAG
jgi:flagellar basal-body rod protein FlgF